MVETWKAVIGYEGRYEVSNLGRVRSKTRIAQRWNAILCLSGRVLKPRRSKAGTHGKGYPNVALSANGEVHCHTIHRLVAEAFIPNPENRPWINHKDGDKYNCHIYNLEWVTRRENELHAIRLGLCNQGINNASAKLTEVQVIEIRSRYVPGKVTYEQLGREYGMAGGTIRDIVTRKTWKHLST